MKKIHFGSFSHREFHLLDVTFRLFVLAVLRFVWLNSWYFPKAQEELELDPVEEVCVRRASEGNPLGYCYFASGPS